MKHLFTLFLFLTSVLTMNAQSVSLFDVDASGFPTVKAKFYAFDAANKQQRPNKSELTITENGQPRTITSVTCPPDTTKSLSVCIMVDTYGYGLIKLAQAGTQRLINYLQPPNDEIAITMMNYGVQIHQDFTSDMAKAMLEASTIPPAPGYVDVQKMFYYPTSGGVPFISGRTSDKKILILVSDLHCPNLNLDTARLYQDAAQHNISVYVVLLGTTDYSGLFKRVAAKTGGKVFELVKTEAQITNIFQEIDRIEHYIPCDITWEGSSCTELTIATEIDWKGLVSSDKYTISANSLGFLTVTPPFVYLGKRLPTSQNDTLLTLTAKNADFTITGINRTSGSANFTIINASFPFVIPKNSSQTVMLHFVPSDSNMTYASFEVSAEQCSPGNFSALGGFPNKKAVVSTLKITKPNGGETYMVGSDTVITWNGVSPTDIVSLEYTTDKATTWLPLTDSASNLHYLWKNIPKPTSTLCMVRAKQHGSSGVGKSGTSQFGLLSDYRTVNLVQWSPDGSKLATQGYSSSGASEIIWSATSAKKLLGFASGNTSYIMNGIQWSPDGSKIATLSGNSHANICSAIFGSVLFKLKGHTDGVNDLQWSPDGLKIATASSDNTAIIWLVSDSSKLFTLAEHTFRLNSVHWSPDGTKVATASDDKTAIIWSAITGTKLFTLSGHLNRVTVVQWSPDGSKVATASADGSAIIWSATSGTPLDTLSHTRVVSAVRWSPDGTKVATSSEDGTAIIWSAANGNLLYTLSGHTDKVWNVQWSPDGLKVATASLDNSAIIWSATDGTKLFTLFHGKGVNDVQWSPDGSKVATASNNKLATIWYIENNFLQEDSSDAVFSIIAPEPTLQNLSIDMGKVLVGQSKDSTVLGIICNKGLAPLHVFGIDITSGDSADFTIPRGAGDFFLDSNKRCQDVMFGFAPTKVGKWVAKATVRTTVGDFIDTITITGEGVAPALAIVNPFIDFGKTLVGTPKDSIKVVTIKNVGTSDLTITQTDYNAVNTTNFSTLAGGNSFILRPNNEAIMDLRFLPNDAGRRSGILQFHYNGVGSPATVQLFGEGVIPSTIVKAQDITAQASEKVNITLKLLKSTGMQIVGAPTNWYARIHYNKSILFNEQTNNVCAGTTDSCVLELTGVYNPKTDELISLPCIATLGNADHSSIIIDEFKWTNSGIVTDVATQNGTVKITGVCEDGGVRLFIPAKSSTSLSSRPNPAQDKLQIQYGLREPLTVTFELLTMTGQVVQTIITNQTQAAGQYTLTTDLSVLGNGVYLLRLRTNKEMLTTRVDVVK